MTKRLQIVIDAVRELAEDGLSVKEAAEAIGLCEQTIRFIARDAGFKFARPPSAHMPSERNEQIAQRFDAGETLEGIAADYGMTRERVRQIVKRMGRTPRQEQRREFLDKIVAAARSEWLTCRELAERFGVSPQVVLTACAGIKLPKRTLSLHATLVELADKVKAGVSVHSLCAGDRLLEQRLTSYCREQGIKSLHGRHRDFSHREDIVRSGRAAGETWDEIAAKLALIEGFRVQGFTIRNWAETHLDPFPAYVRKPRPVRPVREPKPKQLREYKPRVTCPELDIRETVRETALVNRDKASAAQIGAAVGVSRNSIIGHWNRARAAGVIV